MHDFHYGAPIIILLIFLLETLLSQKDPFLGNLAFQMGGNILS
jgi:hypothetical protein